MSKNVENLPLRAYEGIQITIDGCKSDQKRVGVQVQTQRETSAKFETTLNSHSRIMEIVDRGMRRKACEKYAKKAPTYSEFHGVLVDKGISFSIKKNRINVSNRKNIAGMLLLNIL